jgi:HAD superfamily hydrolase (TIGR01509 family)
MSVPVETLAALAARQVPLKLVIFDCDGVLIDSEAMASELTASMVTEAGWALTPLEAMRLFVGLSLRDIVPMVEARIGRALTDDWRETLRTRILAAMAESVAPVPGAIAALHATTALGLQWRIASNSSREEMAVKFGRNDMAALVEGRIHSHRDVARGKPAPDLFLAAAEAGGVAPAECLVIEDSVPGVTGAVAAGMMVLGFDPHHQGAKLQAAGALLFHAMHDVPLLLKTALQGHA